MKIWFLVALVACADPDAARIAELEAELAALREGRLGEPSGWTVVDGAEWATNGHVLVRRDAPRLDPALVRPAWLHGTPVEELAAAIRVPEHPVVLEGPVDVLYDAGTPVLRFRRDGGLVHVDAAYAVVLVGQIVQGPDPLGPVHALGPDGTVVAVVMPRRAP